MIRQYSIISLKLLILIFLLSESPSLTSAYERVPPMPAMTNVYPHILKCDTACHKIKNIALSKKNRTTRTECRESHVGATKTPVSPFFPPDKVFITKTPISPFLPPDKVFITKTSGYAIKPTVKFSPLLIKKKQELQH